MKNKTVCFVPIRLNSQRIKKKSIINIHGRPMFCWSLETLDKLQIPVYVYTNEISTLRNLLDFSPNNIIWLKRPEYLDGHQTKGIDIYREFSRQVDAETYLLCHCTSPFVKLSTYQKCINSVNDSSFLSSLTAKEEQTFTWYNHEPLNFSLPRQKTQDLQSIYIETSAAYCYKKEVLELNSRTCKNPKIILTTGIENIDIDEPRDLEILELIPRKNK